MRALLRRALLPGATVAGLAWAVASLFAPAPAPRAEAAGPAGHIHASGAAPAAVAPGTTGRLPRATRDAVAKAPAATKTARLAVAPGNAVAAVQAQDPFDKAVRAAALTPDRMRVVLQNAYLVAGLQGAAHDAVASAAPGAAPAGEAEVSIAALTPAIVPLPQSRPRLADVVKPDKPEKPAEAVAAAKPEKPAAGKPEKPAGLLAGLFGSSPEKPSPEKPAAPEKPGKTLTPAKPGKPEVAMAAMAFARPDSPDRGMAGAFNGLFNKPRAGNGVAVYDISAGVVIMPNGDRLEAHSGIGKMADDPRFVHVKMNGPTPPNTYKLSMREKRFHGVEAIRMTPVGDEPMHGRTGILAHSYLLRGRTGQSHGCVAFEDYARFLKAFKAGHVTHLVVVPGNGASKQRVASNSSGA